MDRSISLLTVCYSATQLLLGLTSYVALCTYFHFPLKKSMAHGSTIENDIGFMGNMVFVDINKACSIKEIG